ncbi:MAG: glycine zipper 2TM domain-containing protein [Pseudomonadota bacterium]
MKTAALFVAAGSLAVISAPTNAADTIAGLGTGIAPRDFSTSFDIEPTRYNPDDWDDDRWEVDDDWEDRRRYRRGRGQVIYDRRGRYIEPRRIGRRDRIWRGRDGRYYCRRDNGTTGLVIGAGVGALLGRTIDTRGDRTVGTLLGGALGAVIGRELDRGDIRCR